MKTRLATMILVSMTYGCQSSTLSQARHDAQLHWREVRAKIKLQLAQQQYDAGLFEDADRSAKEVIFLSPNSHEPYVLLARAQFQQGAFAACHNTLQQATDLGLKSAALSYVLGVLQEHLGDLDDALASFVAARQQEPDGPQYLEAEVECLMALKRPEQALDLLSTQTKYASDDGTLDALAAHIFSANKDDENALRLYGLALRQPNDSRLVTEEFGVRLAQVGRCDESLLVLNPLLASTPDEETSARVRRSVALCELRQGRGAAARSVLESYAASHESDTVAQILLAKASLLEGDFMLALAALERGSLYAPSDVELLLVRATVNWRRGRLDSAAADLFDLIEQDDDHVDAHCLLAEILRSTRRPEAARSHFERALALDHDSAWASAGLAALRGTFDPIAPPQEPVLTSRVQP